jgi:peroxiredoxin
MSNDPTEHPEDSFENMIEFAKKYNFNFPYVIDEDQSVAIKYDAVCTPDFFGFNSNLKLQYRGRIYEINNRVRVKDSKNELLESMINVAKTNKGPEIQSPSMGCSIKWFK